MKSMHEERNVNFKVKFRIVGVREAVKKRLRNWQKVFWSDESLICLYHTDGRVHVRRFPGELLIWSCVQGTVAGGLGVVWGAFSSDRILDLKVLNGTLYSQK